MLYNTLLTKALTYRECLLLVPNQLSTISPSWEIMEGKRVNLRTTNGINWSHKYVNNCLPCCRHSFTPGKRAKRKIECVERGLYFSFLRPRYLLPDLRDRWWMTDDRITRARWYMRQRFSDAPVQHNRAHLPKSLSYSSVCAHSLPDFKCWWNLMVGISSAFPWHFTGNGLQLLRVR